MSEPKQSGVPVAGPSGDSVGVDAFQHVNHIDREAQGAHRRYFSKQQDPDVLGCGRNQERGGGGTRTASSCTTRATSSDASDARNAGGGGDTPDFTRENNLLILLRGALVSYRDQRPARVEASGRWKVIGTQATAGKLAGTVYTTDATAQPPRGRILEELLYWRVMYDPHYQPFAHNHMLPSTMAIISY